MHATFKEEDNHYGVACGIRFALHGMPFSLVLRCGTILPTIIRS